MFCLFDFVWCLGGICVVGALCKFVFVVLVFCDGWFAVFCYGGMYCNSVGSLCVLSTCCDYFVCLVWLVFWFVSMLRWLFRFLVVIVCACYFVCLWFDLVVVIVLVWWFWFRLVLFVYYFVVYCWVYCLFVSCLATCFLLWVYFALLICCGSVCVCCLLV